MNDQFNSLLIFTDYDLDDIPLSLMDDNSTRKIYVGSRERRSLTRKIVSLEQFFSKEEDTKYERLTEQSGHQDFFQGIGNDERYKRSKYVNFISFNSDNYRDFNDLYICCRNHNLK